MGIEVNLVDGHAGKAHVTSDDLAAFNEAAYGARACVLPYGKELALTVAGAASATLSTGAGIVAGRRFLVDAPLTVEMDKGASGLNRIDVVVARYAKTDKGIESVSIEVVRGTAAASAAQPEVEDGDLPLWRVFFNGASIAGVRRLTEPVAALAASDRVVASGTCDFWTWRMWESGIAECWGKTGSATEGVSTAWGSLFEGDEHHNGFPGNTSESAKLAFSAIVGGEARSQLFCDVPDVCECGFESADNAFLIETGAGMTALRTPSVYLLRPTSDATVTGRYTYRAVGRWK